MPPTVVIFRLGSIGDTVVSLPCFHAIARAFPHHRRLVLTNQPVAAEAAPLLSVLGDEGLVHGALSYPVGTRRPSDLLRLAGQLRALKADTLIHLSPPRGSGSVERDWLFFRACGFARIIGLPRARDLGQCRVDPETGEVEREASRLTRTLARDLGPIALNDADNWDLGLTDTERHAAQMALGPIGPKEFVAINMGGKDPAKDWGERNWADLAQRLSKRWPGLGLVTLGAVSDRNRAKAIVAAWTGPSLDLSGRIAPREGAAVLEQASLFIGHDSGPLHLAAVSGTPTIGLFGPLNHPIQWHPVGDHVLILHNLEGMAKITVAEVAAAAEDRMRGGSIRRPGGRQP